MIARPYDPALHRGACLALFDSNVGGTFRAEERADFEGWLDDPPPPYWVFLEGDRVVACGGYATEDDGVTASVCWTVVGRRDQGRGLGARMCRQLVDDAAASGRFEAMRLDTIPETAGFFRTLGFETVELDPDGYGPGLPRVEMRRVL